MTDTPKVSNVLAVYNLASGREMREGLSWYLDAHNYAHMLAGGNRGRFGHDAKVARAAGVIAALSPLNGWENNKRCARILFERNGDGTGLGLYRNVAKAEAIYAGADPLDILGGFKVRAFYQTIHNPQGDFDPVIDRHAFDIAVGEVTDDKRRATLSRKGVYHDFAHVYREAATIAGIGPAQMQAVTWVTWRNSGLRGDLLSREVVNNLEEYTAALD